MSQNETFKTEQESDTIKIMGIIFCVFIVVFNFESTLVTADVLTLPQTAYIRCTKDKEFGACYELGYLYQHTSKPGDKALGNQYIRHGCKLEFKKPCKQSHANTQSLLYLKAKKQWDTQKQKALNDMNTVKTKDEIDCEKNVDAKACGRAGNYFFYLAPILNPEKGKAMFEEGCRLGDKGSCQSFDLIKKGIVRVYDVEM